MSNKPYPIERQVRDRILDFREVFSSDLGKLVLGYIKEMCQFDTIQGILTAEQYAYLQGMRDLYLKIRLNAEMTDKEIKKHIDNLAPLCTKEEYLNNFNELV